MNVDAHLAAKSPNLNRTLLIVDVQNDFVEGGSLAVTGGTAVAEKITEFLRADPDRYATVIASRDWHTPGSDNGGHFADTPDFVDTWPAHCVAGTDGAQYAPGLDTSLVKVHVKKGMDAPAYSMFQGVTDDGRTIEQVLFDAKAMRVDVVGIATDHCVRATVLDALAAGISANVLVDLCAGVAANSTAMALVEMDHAGAHLMTTADLA